MKNYWRWFNFEFTRTSNDNNSFTFLGLKPRYNLFKTFDLLLLDVNVPNINGFELLNHLRKNGIKTPSNIFNF